MINSTIEVYGRLDCAFNNAGIEGAVGVPLSDSPEDDWDQVIDINLKGVWLCMKYELAHMAREGAGAKDASAFTRLSRFVTFLQQ